MCVRPSSGVFFGKVVFHIVSPSIVVSKSANLPVHAFRSPRKNNCSPPPPLFNSAGSGELEITCLGLFRMEEAAVVRQATH